jgi:EpsI family protein
MWSPHALEIAGATLEIRRTDGGVPLAIYLAGVGWWGAVRAGGGVRDALRAAARLAPLGFLAQALALCLAFALLAGRASNAARAVLDYDAWVVLGVALYWVRPARIESTTIGATDRPGHAVVGSVAWGLALRPRLNVDATAMDALPIRLGSWTSEDVPLESTVESMLRADYNVQRRYQHEFGDVVWVYFGYYGTERGGTPEHTPQVCYRAQGWQIEEHELVEVDGELSVNELVVSLGSEQQLVHYWFRSFQRTGLRDGFDQLLDHLVGRVLHGRADGSLVRISTPIEGGDRDSARSRLLAFDVSFNDLLGTHWPREAAGQHR